MLTGKEIKARLGKDIFISDFNEEQLNPNSYNLKLHDELEVYDYCNAEDNYASCIDMKEKNKTKKIKISEDGYVLEPGKLYLARTKEFTETHNLIPCLSGRSSIGRLGINVHVTAGFGDIGFKGYWTLEIFVIEPVKIYPDVDICQIYYFEPTGEIEEYNGKYQNNTGIDASKLFLEMGN